MKYVIAVTVIAALLWLIRRQRRRPPPREPGRTAEAGRPSTPALMCRCRHCGVHLAVAEAVREGGEVFCSHEHRVEHARRGG